MPFSSIEEALAEFRQGRMVVVVDDEDRENEGDLTVAAEFITPEIINFMALNGRGLICLALGRRSATAPVAVDDPPQHVPVRTAFCEAIDARRA